MMRIAKVVAIRPGQLDRYVALHKAPWPGVLDALTRNHVHNYSIFHDGGLLFSYFEYLGDDYEADMIAIGADPESQRWVALFAGTFTPVPGAAPGELRSVLDEIFHLD